MPSSPSVSKTAPRDRIPGVLAACSVLLLYVWVMLLPLVGRSGAAAAHAGANGLASASVLLLSLVLSGIAGIRLRKNAQPWPRFLRILCLVQGLAFLLLSAGAFKV